MIRKHENTKTRDTLRGLSRGPSDTAPSSTATKRGVGRPAKVVRRDRLVTLLPPDLKRWLAYQAIAETRDMSDIVSEALEAYRERKGGVLLDSLDATMDDAAREMARRPAAKRARATAKRK